MFPPFYKSKIAIGLLFGLVLLAFSPVNLSHFVELEYPDYWPKPTYDLEQSPLTSEKIALGRKLFYDPILSRDTMVACANCHLSYTAFTHVDHALSHGIGDSIGTRNSPTLINLAWQEHFMWDGAVNHLDMQALAPISHEDEMGDNLPNVLRKLQNSAVYPALFEAAFGDSLISSSMLLKALAQFQLTFVSANSKYDQVIRGDTTFSEQEATGYALFQKNCVSCHQEPLFTTGEFASNRLPIDSTLMDFGRYLVTKNPSDSLKFKIPTLRNIEFSFPYMHDGRFKKLNDVMRHYDREMFPLSSRERVDLTAFLLTLTDKEFLFNRDFAFLRE